MLPANLLTALKALALSQKPLPAAAEETAPKAAQFELGQKIQGSVQAQVAPGVFKVNVAGQLVQMQLPPTIRSGDTVALQVISTKPRLTFSMVNSANPLSTPEQLGSVARLLSSMSQQSPEKAYVRAPQNTPLFVTPQPPPSKELAGKLQQALSNSGLFYESHQAQWLEGSRTTAQLLVEPQNLPPGLPGQPGQPGKAGQPSQPGELEQASLPGRLAQPGPNPQEPAGKAATPMPHEAVQQPVPAAARDNAGKATMPHQDGGKSATAPNTADNTATASANNASPTPATHNAAHTDASTQPNATQLADNKALNIPEHLQPLVQQQLNALETRQMLWQGNVWPGQEMQWEIHEQAPQTPDEETQRQWVTQLRLDLPHLGEVAATLRLNSAGLSLALNAATPETLTLMGSASTRLVAALADAGIPVVSTQILQGTPE